MQEFALSDAHLASIRWESDGRDLAFDLRLGDGGAATLRCSWVSAVEIGLSWPEGVAGMPLSWECRCEQKGSRWGLAIDFASQGCVRLECSEARLDYNAG